MDRTEIRKGLTHVVIGAMAHYDKKPINEAGRIIELVVNEARRRCGPHKSEFEMDNQVIETLVEVMRDGLNGHWPSVTLSVPTWEDKAAT
jgi:hypothetical protein